MKAIAGMKLSYRLQCQLSGQSEVPSTESIFASGRVPRIEGSKASTSGAPSAAAANATGAQLASLDEPLGELASPDSGVTQPPSTVVNGRVALNDALYQLLRVQRQHRRAFINSLIAQFTECLNWSERLLHSAAGSSPAKRSLPVCICLRFPLQLALCFSCLIETF